jgi:hypothetical protein
MEITFGGVGIEVEVGEKTQAALAAATAAAASAATAGEHLADLAETLDGAIGLFTAHTVPDFVGVESPGAATADYFGAFLALNFQITAETVVDGLGAFVNSASTITIWKATATNLVDGKLTASSVVTRDLGDSVTTGGVVTGTVDFDAAALAPLGDLTGHFLVWGGNCAYAEGDPPEAGEEWAVIDTGTGAVDLQTNREIQMKLRYHDSFTYTLDYTGEQIIAAIEALPSAPTAKMRTAARDYGFFPQALVRAEAVAPNDIPTVTLGAAYAASTLNGDLYSAPNLRLDTSADKIAFLGGVAVMGGGGGWQARGAWYGLGLAGNGFGAIEFDHDGDAFEVCIQTYGDRMRILVDDRIVYFSAALPLTGEFHYALVEFPTARARRVRIEYPDRPIMGISVADPAEVAVRTRDYPLFTFLADSFGEGTTGTAYSMDGQVVSAVRALGGHCPHGGVGGTGLINPGGGGRVRFTDADRLKDLTMAGVTDAITGQAVAVDCGLLLMSINDSPAVDFSAYGATFQAAIENRVWAVIDAWQAAQPGKPLVVIGPTAPNSTPATSINDLYRIRDAGQQAAFGAAPGNVWFIDRFSPAVPLLRQGVYSNAADQASLYTIGTEYEPPDPTHPNQAGHTLDALWLAQELRALILGQFG